MEKSSNGENQESTIFTLQNSPKDLETGNTEYTSENAGEWGTKIKLVESL